MPDAGPRRNGAGPIRILVGSCLLGERVRYDGGHKRDAFLVETLGHVVEYVPVCPVSERGLPTAGRRADVLTHMAGHFRKILTPDGAMRRGGDCPSSAGSRYRHRDGTRIPDASYGRGPDAFARAKFSATCVQSTVFHHASTYSARRF